MTAAARDGWAAKPRYALRTAGSFGHASGVGTLEENQREMKCRTADSAMVIRLL
jgi:hypothetical protein